MMEISRTKLSASQPKSAGATPTVVGRKILITGGAGFIGTALCRHLLTRTDDEIVNLDALTYAANMAGVDELRRSPRYRLVEADLRGADLLAVFQEHRPDGVMHLAAESHVDRSIDEPGTFVETNVLGTCNLLAAARAYWENLPEPARANFRFHHVSTDEVYGSLGPEGFFTEESPYDPRSPYSASKAASDHLVRAWGHTYGLPVVLSNCSNNYGPGQFPEKLIPLMIANALEERSLPVYGDGLNVRDWLYVEDHVRALEMVFKRGRPGRSYNVGGHNEVPNIEVVKTLCRLLDQARPRPNGASYAELIRFVADRPGHDRRYAIDAGRIEREMGWKPKESFESGLARTVAWYLEHEDWWKALRQGYQERAGLRAK